MIVDLAQQPLESSELRANVCIVGGGPAGISLALELARSRPGWQIVLTEAGGFDNATTRERDIYRVALGEKSYGVLTLSRRRKLGGTSAHWGGWSKPLDVTDYEDNTRWDLPAWPFGAETLRPHLDKARQWLEIPSGDFSMAGIRQRHQASLLHSLSAELGEQLFRFSPPTRFGERYRKALEDQHNLFCLTHANVTALEFAGERVVGAHARALAGEPLAIHADYTVLAMGGMETTRLLLNLRGEAKDDGDGIYSPNLGRYFADHYGLRPGVVLAPRGLQYNRFGDDSGPVMPVLTFSPDKIRREGLNNCCIMLNAQGDDESLLQGYGSQAPLGFPGGQSWHYGVQLNVEPRPHYDSRLSLTDSRCELGLRRLKLDWRQHDNDFQSAYTLFEALGDDLALQGTGRRQLTEPDSPALRSRVDGACHHLGTTRMAADARDGVVDPDLKVYGTENLYIASSSVFPRYGYSNPTLTIVALAVRLASHLMGTDEGIN